MQINADQTIFVNIVKVICFGDNRATSGVYGVRLTPSTCFPLFKL